jgi:hypothetical protein
VKIFGTGARKAELYVTGIVCREGIVLGGLDRGGRGREWGNFETFFVKFR